MKKHLIVSAIIAVLLLSGAYVCPLYQVVGIPCPACGITRAYRLLLSGRLSDAFNMHPLFWLPPLFLLKPFQKKRVFILAAAAFIIVYIWRFSVLFPDTPPFNYNYHSRIGEILK